MNISKAEIARQYARIKKLGWLPLFERAARVSGTSTALMLALGSRETNLKNIRGDFQGGKYHGFGVLQVDIGTDAAYARAWTPLNVEPGIARGAEILDAKLDQVENGQGHRLSVRGRSFVGAKVEADDVRRIGVAAYNCGLWAFYHFSRKENIDSTTTGDDYSRDVYDRAVEFAELLETDGAEQDAFVNEVTAQGKYATEDARKRANVKGKRLRLPVAEPMDSQEELARASYHHDDNEEPLVANAFDDSQTSAEQAAPLASVAAAASLIVPTAVVAVEQAKPAQDLPQPESAVDKATRLGVQVKAWYMAVPTAIVSGFTALYKWATGADVRLVGVLLLIVALIVVVYVVGRLWLTNNDRKRDDLKAAREHELKMQREEQAHEITVLQAKSASDPNAVTVQVVPKPLQNSDSAP